MAQPTPVEEEQHLWAAIHAGAQPFLQWYQANPAAIAALPQSLRDFANALHNSFTRIDNDSQARLAQIAPGAPGTYHINDGFIHLNNQYNYIRRLRRQIITNNWIAGHHDDANCQQFVQWFQEVEREIIQGRDDLSDHAINIARNDEINHLRRLENAITQYQARAAARRQPQIVNANPQAQAVYRQTLADYDQFLGDRLIEIRNKLQNLQAQPAQPYDIDQEHQLLQRLKNEFDQETTRLDTEQRQANARRGLNPQQLLDVQAHANALRYIRSQNNHPALAAQVTSDAAGFSRLFNNYAPIDAARGLQPQPLIAQQPQNAAQQQNQGGQQQGQQQQFASNRVVNGTSWALSTAASFGVSFGLRASFFAAATTLCVPCWLAVPAVAVGAAVGTRFIMDYGRHLLARRRAQHAGQQPLPSFNWRRSVRNGLIAGGIGLVTGLAAGWIFDHLSGWFCPDNHPAPVPHPVEDTPNGGTGPKHNHHPIGGNPDGPNHPGGANDTGNGGTGIKHNHGSLNGMLTPGAQGQLQNLMNDQAIAGDAQLSALCQQAIHSGSQHDIHRFLWQLKKTSFHHMNGHFENGHWTGYTHESRIIGAHQIDLGARFMDRLHEHGYNFHDATAHQIYRDGGFVHQFGNHYGVSQDFHRAHEFFQRAGNLGTPFLHPGDPGFGSNHGGLNNSMHNQFKEAANSNLGHTANDNFDPRGGQHQQNAEDLNRQHLHDLQQHNQPQNPYQHTGTHPQGITPEQVRGNPHPGQPGANDNPGGGMHGGQGGQMPPRPPNGAGPWGAGWRVAGGGGYHPGGGGGGGFHHGGGRGR